MAIIIGIILIVASLILFALAGKKLISASEQSKTAERVLNQARAVKIEKQAEQKQYQQLKSEINTLISQKTKLLEVISKEKEETDKLFIQQKNRLLEQIDLYKNSVASAATSYVDTLEQKYAAAEARYQERMGDLERQTSAAVSELQKLKDTLAAGVQAQLREREKEEQLDYYKLQLSDLDYQDVQLLNSIKPQLRQPVILSKLIWSTYFLKQTTEMCNRILGTKPICGIYKITNIETKQCYIGQSVNISDRWKQHIKCGLGIDASATNKLYNAMQKYGVWNFTFELLEECPRTQLDEKEKKWIELYQSDIYSYNSTKGNH